MTTQQIITELRNIQAQIETDRYTYENIQALINKLSK